MLKNNNVIKVISLLTAIVLWIYVIVEENPTVTQKYDNISVQILNEESLIQRGLTLVGNNTPTVAVTLEGKRAELNKVKAQDILVFADVFGYSIGENHIPVNVSAPDNVKVVEVKQNKIKLQIDELISVGKAIEVVVMDGEPVDKELGEITVQPQEVMLTGAKSVVEAVKNVNAVIEKTEFTESGNTVTSSLVVRDEEGEKIDGISLSSKTAEINSSLLTVKEVTLNVEVIGEVDTKYTVTGINVPETVMIKGKKEEIEKIEYVNGNPIDISNTVVTGKIPINVELPEGIQLANASQDVHVYIVVKAVSTAEFTVDASKIEITGLGQGMTAAFDPNIKFTLTVAGAETMVRGAAIDDFRIIADLTNLSAGTHIVPLKLEYTKAFTGAKVTPAEIEITINGE